MRLPEKLFVLAAVLVLAVVLGLLARFGDFSTPMAYAIGGAGFGLLIAFGTPYAFGPPRRIGPRLRLNGRQMVLPNEPAVIADQDQDREATPEDQVTVIREGVEHGVLARQVPVVLTAYWATVDRPTGLKGRFESVEVRHEMVRPKASLTRGSA